MKRKSKPRSPAEIAKRLGITQEQLEAQAREQAKESFRKEGLLGPELTPREKEELEKQARAAPHNSENRSGDWPFPLIDMNDPGRARHATRIVRKNYMSEVCFRREWENAIDVALTIRPAWAAEGLALREVPRAENPNWPTKQDFIRLEQWFLDAEIARGKQLGKTHLNDLASRAQAKKGTAAALATVLSLVLIGIFEFAVYGLPWVWLRDHANSYGIQAGVDVAVLAIMLGLFIPCLRKVWWLVIGVVVIGALITILGGPQSAHTTVLPPPSTNTTAAPGP